jgi:esterase/lipase
VFALLILIIVALVVALVFGVRHYVKKEETHLENFKQIIENQKDYNEKLVERFEKAFDNFKTTIKDENDKFVQQMLMFHRKE